MMNGIDWTNCSPREAGIRSESISEALDFPESHMIPMHSLLVIRGGKAAVEAYWEPYCTRTLHRMFSVTKSLVSLAAGVLVSDGRISLDDKVLDFFLGTAVPDRFRILTLRHMLSMRTCHSRASHKLVPGSSYTGSYSDDWVGSFFRTIDGDHQPGTFFSYDDTAAHVVGAIVEKVSRMDLIYDIEAPDLATMVKRVMNVTGCTDEQETTKMAMVVRDIAERCRQTMITDGSCGMRELKAWVLSTMITKDPYESALSTVISSASADPENRADLITTCLEKQYMR